MSAADFDDARPDAEALRIDVRRGAPTPEELAAVIAVVSESYAQEAAEAVVDEQKRPSAWRVAARAPRPQVRRDVRWGGFAG